MTGSETELGLRMSLLDSETIEAVSGLDRACFANPSLQADFKAELGREQSRCLLASLDGEVVGYLLYWMVVGEMQILNIAVDPSMRRKGFGQLLLEEGVRRAIAEGAWVATLEVRESNEAAKKLYKTMGFRVLGTRVKYYSNPVEDALLMVKAFS